LGTNDHQTVVIDRSRLVGGPNDNTVALDGRHIPGYGDGAADTIRLDRVDGSGFPMNTRYTAPTTGRAIDLDQYVVDSVEWRIELMRGISDGYLLLSERIRAGGAQLFYQPFLQYTTELHLLLHPDGRPKAMRLVFSDQAPRCFVAVAVRTMWNLGAMNVQEMVHTEKHGIMLDVVFD
jgi:hypothetical protein